MTMSVFTALPSSHVSYDLPRGIQPISQKNTPSPWVGGGGESNLNLGVLDSQAHTHPCVHCRDKRWAGLVPPTSSYPGPHPGTGLPLAWVTICGSGCAPGSPTGKTRVVEPLFQ